MKGISGNLFKKIFSKFAFAFMFIVSIFIVTACDDDYKNMKLILSNDGASIVLEMENNAFESKSVTVTIEGSDSISRDINVSVDNAKITFLTEKTSTGATIITLSASGVCENAMVTITTLEGNKSATFLVSAIIPVQNLNSSANRANLFAIKDTPNTLEISNLVQFSPSITTQRGVIFTLGQDYGNTASILNNVLSVSKDFAESTINLIATSASNSEVFATITLDVLDKLTTENVTSTLKYTSDIVGDFSDLTKTIQIANNITSKSSISIMLKIASSKNVTALPYFKSTLTSLSEAIIIESSSKKVEETQTTFTFVIKTNQIVGEDEIFFVTAYDGYKNYSFATSPIKFATYDAVKDLSVNVNGSALLASTYTVYNNYYGIRGLEITSSALPTTVDASDKKLILSLIGDRVKNNFDFYLNTNSTAITFVDNEFEFTSGDKIFVVAKSTFVSETANVRITSKADSSIFKNISLFPQTGASVLEFTNAELTSGSDTLYLAIGDAEAQEITFITPDIANLEIKLDGKNFEVGRIASTGNTIKGTAEYLVPLKAIANAKTESGKLILTLPNGLTRELKVEVIDTISTQATTFSVPSLQNSSSVGMMTRLESYECANSPNLEFSVALKNKNSVVLSEATKGVVSISYEFYDYTLESASLTPESLELYKNSEWEKSIIIDGVSNLTFTTNSSIINPVYLNISQNSQKILSAVSAGKVWVKATVKGLTSGFGLNETTLTTYFLVEVYEPITTFNLSASTVNLYAQNSLGIDDFNKSIATLSVNLSANATYNNIIWKSNNFTLDYTPNGVKVYKFEGDNSNVKITAYSTYGKVETGLLTEYKNLPSLSFIFTGSIQEFGVTYITTLKVNILRAQQVEKIAVLNVNIDEGIYIPLSFDGKSIYRDIDAEVLIGESGVMPLNTRLCYEFVSFVSGNKNSVSINENTGLITIKSDASVGYAGFVRIAPKDRYTELGYTPNGSDVSIIIPITIADGRSRDTAYRITKLNEINLLEGITAESKSNLHYVLVGNDQVTSDEDFAIFENFDGGLYGSYKNETNYHTITTNKPLFATLTQNAVIEDLIIVGNISGNGALANENNGQIKNVTVDLIVNGGVYAPSTITSAGAYAGGLVALNNGTIDSCNFFGKLIANNSIAGGLVGLNAGSILNSKVEMYRFSAENYGSINATNSGGLVGEMTDGTLLNSYFYSYVKTSDGKNLGINTIDGTSGGLVSALTGGEVNKCFAFANGLNKLTANSGDSYINNAYILFYNNASGEEVLDSFYIQDSESKLASEIILNDIWTKSETLNSGLPYFAGLLQVTPNANISNTFADLENIIAGENKAIFFHYSTSAVGLSMQEKLALKNKNTILLSDLLGESAVGVRAISSNSQIVSTTSNSLVINSVGTASITIFSKYDYSTKQIFKVYVINPLDNFALNYNNKNFANNSKLYIKLSNNFTFNGNINNSLVLDSKERLITTNYSNLSLAFPSYTYNGAVTDFADNGSYITSQGLGPISLDLNKFVDDKSIIDKFSLSYDLKISLIEKFAETELNDINILIKQKYSGSFEINFYRGADSIFLSKSSAQIEPSDTTVLEGYIFTDILTDQIKMEVLTAKFVNFIDTTNAISQINIEYYDNANDLNVVDESVAKYYKISYKISLNIANQFKNYTFNGDQIQIRFYAESSKANHSDYSASLLEKTFTLTVNAQSLINTSANYYPLIEKTSDYIGSQNVIILNYDKTSSSVIVPDEEGILKVNLYPNYADFDYIIVSSTNKLGAGFENVLHFGLLKKYDSERFTRLTSGYSSLENGIKIFNTYKEFNENTLSTLYLSTYLVNTVKKDTIFEISIKAYKNNSEINSKTFTLVCQYLQGATISVTDDDGNSLTTVARGSTSNLNISVPKNQTLTIESIQIDGRSSSTDVENKIIYTNRTIIDNPNSLFLTYQYKLYVGKNLMITQNANSVTIHAVVKWDINGKLQTKETSIDLGIVDFVIDEISLLTDKADKTTLNAYIGVDTNLQFDFNGNSNNGGNASFENFLNNFKYDCVSGESGEGHSDLADYFVNYGKVNPTSFLGNLYYDNGTAVLNDNGTFNLNSYVSFSIENGIIKITGKRLGTVKLTFDLPIKYPNTNLTKHTIFEFTVNISTYSDENLPAVIESETAFTDARDSTQAQNYILMSDIYLYNYTPGSTSGFTSLDGNNYTINIMSFNTDYNSSSLELALFTEVTENTTLKNIIVNVYHSGQLYGNISTYNSIKVAGLAITNSGIIYNCSVVSYRVDFTSDAITDSGIKITYLNSNNSFESTVAGFVIENKGYITNSRVGGKTLEFIHTTSKVLSPFNIEAKGNISGFVYDNSGYIASSYFDNGTIFNSTSSGIETYTSGFVGFNSGKIYTSYAKGTGANEISLSGAGISTSSISAGFVYSNSHTIGDCYANIFLATDNQDKLESGRFTAGFVYKNTGTIERSFTASKIEDAKNTQSAFVGTDGANTMLNSGKIIQSYYYASPEVKNLSYNNISSNLNIIRITEPDDEERYYGLSFADNASTLNGVWYSTPYGIELVSSNQIAVSNRYIANAERDPNTNELIKYDLPYTSGYEYGSSKNPIIIRSQTEFNTVFSGDALLAGSAVASYFTSDTVFGNYRLICDINLREGATDDSSGIKVESSKMNFSSGLFDGNMLTISGVDLMASQNERAVESYGLFSKITNNAVIMNLNVNVVAVGARDVKYVGVIAGSVINSKLVNISLNSASQTTISTVLGNNIVGGLVGKVQGSSEIKNIVVNNISVKANYNPAGISQTFNRSLDASVTINNDVSYAGGVIGVADIYEDINKSKLTHLEEMNTPSLTYLKVSGSYEIRASTAGGVIGYLGGQTFLKDSTLELGNTLNQKIIAYKFFAGGIVGECYGDIDMARAEHASVTQTEIEDNVNLYYKDPINSKVNRGNMTVFEDSVTSKYEPKAIGGLVGNLVSGNISHSYSKINVRNSKASFAGGVIGQISYINNYNYTTNHISLLEVYAFGDVLAKISSSQVTGAGGIVGYIDYNRNLTFNRVNAVNYFSLTLNESTELLSLPANLYQIYSAVGSAKPNDIKTAINIYDVVSCNNNNVTFKENTTAKSYKLPIISSTVEGEDIYAVINIKYSENGTVKTISPKGAYARLTESAMYNLVYSNRGVVAFYDLVNSGSNGKEMDTYFLKANWDVNYWTRYTSDLLPSLITYAETYSYYIDTPEDLKKMVSYPNATFIVRAKNQTESKIINIGAYLLRTGLNLNNFSGILKGLDKSTEYGFDFNGATSFIKTTSGAKIYNLTIKNLSNNGQYQDKTTSFVGSSNQSSFEDLKFKSCKINSYVNKDNLNVGILANTITGGYFSNISFEDCGISAKVNGNVRGSDVNLGFICGKATVAGSSYLQVLDTTLYSTGNANNNFSIKIDTGATTIDEVNMGGLIGYTDGNIIVNFTASSSSNGIVKGIGTYDGNIGSGYRKYTPDTLFTGAYKGLVLEVDNTDVFKGVISTFNGGLLLGKATNSSISFQRDQDSKLYVVGGSKCSNRVDVVNANIGGILGNAGQATQIANGSNSIYKYVAVDADLVFTAETANVGQIVGLASSIGKIDNIDAYGYIEVTGTNNSLGGFVGKLTGDGNISYALSRTQIKHASSADGTSNIGGFIGNVATSLDVAIGESGTYSFCTRYLGNITINGDNVGELNIGGIVGGVNASTNLSKSLKINNTSFGGNIVVNKAKLFYIGGLVGKTSENLPTSITQNLSYGDISINDKEFTDKSFVAGILGQGSSSTSIYSNYSLATLTSKKVQNGTSLNLSAIVGSPNGTNSDGSNLYSHEITLCLENNNVTGGVTYGQNSYYNTERGAVKAILSEELVSSYINTFNIKPDSEEKSELYLGSKLKPYILNNDEIVGLTEIFTNSGVGVNSTDRKYIVVNRNMSNQYIPSLVNAHLVGDGFTVQNRTSALLGAIDEKSIVSGFKIKAQISTETLTNGGIGILANSNFGKIFSCNVTEISDVTEKINIVDNEGLGLTTSASAYVGALVGVNNAGGQILDCFSDADINAPNATAGGLVGQNIGFISSSYSTGTVLASSKYAFASGTGEIYYSYTASRALDGFSPFGNNTCLNCHNDIYASGSTAGTSINGKDNNTYYMSVIQSTDIKDVFLKFTTESGEIENNKADLKFAYQHDYNFGYLSFCGTEYVNLEYLQSRNTGNGNSAESKKLINSIGKLQQLNTAENSQEYLIIDDLTLTQVMKDNDVDSTENYKVSDWLPVGLSGSKFTGKLDGNACTITNINVFEGDKNASIFGYTDSATISNLTVKCNALNFTAGYDNIAGLVGDALDTSLNDITIALTSITTDKKAENIGGIIGVARGSTEISGETTVNITGDISSTYNDSRSSVNIGGLVGKSESDETISCKSVTLANISSQVSANIGGLVGEIISDSSVSVSTVTIGKISSTGINSCLGGLVGMSTDATFEGITLSKIVLEGLGSKMGGLAGSATSTTFGSESNEISSSNEITITSSETSTESYLGGICGKAEEVTVTNIALTGTKSLKSEYGTSYIGSLYGKATGECKIASEAVSNLDKVTITFKNDNANYIGGLIGYVSGATLKSALTVDKMPTISVSGDASSTNNYFGGLAGKIDSSSSIKNIAISNFKVNTNDNNKINANVGGLAGTISSSTIEGITIIGPEINSYDKDTTAKIGGISSTISSTIIKNSTVSNAQITLKGNGRAGGFVGEVESGSEIVSPIFNGDVQDKGKAGFATTSVGGIVGYSASAELKILSAQNNSGHIKSYSCAGGILGYGQVAQISKADDPEKTDDELLTKNSATITAGTEGAMEINEDGTLKLDDLGNPYENGKCAETPYAGGIVGYLTEGEISYCNNLSSVTSGWQNNNTATKVSRADVIRGSYSSDGKFVMDNKFEGASQSYAGGICAYSNIRIVGEENVINIKNCSNLATVTAKAKTDLQITRYETGLLGYEAKCYYGVQDEKAYSNGITFINNTNNYVFENCLGNGTIVGGRKIEFNMFWSTAAEFSNKRFYILDYGYNEGALYASWAIYRDWNMTFGIGGIAVWKGSNLEMVMYEKGEDDLGQQRTYGNEIVLAANGAKTEFDFGQPVWKTADGNDYLHYWDADGDGERDINKYYLKRVDDITGLASWVEYTGSRIADLEPTPDSLSNRFIYKTEESGAYYYNSISNLGKTTGSGITVLGDLIKTLNGDFMLLRNTTPNGEGSADVYTRLSNPYTPLGAGEGNDDPLDEPSVQAIFSAGDPDMTEYDLGRLKWCDSENPSQILHYKDNSDDLYYWGVDLEGNSVLKKFNGIKQAVYIN